VTQANAESGEPGFTARLAGRVVVVTGAASGLGRETARLLAHEGARVVVLDRSRDEAEATVAELAAIADGGHFAVTPDVASAAEVQIAFDEIRATAGRVDGLVNSAGIREITPLLEIGAEEWEHVVAVNLNGSFYCAQAAARVMRDGDGGSIVNISSVAGLVAFENRPAYASTKAAVVGLTMSLAKDLARYGIRANAIAPGLMQTPLTQAYFEDEGFTENLHLTIPMGRAGRPRDIANMAVFLLSDLSGFVSGAVLPVDGAFMASGAFDVRGGESAMNRAGTGTA
jgi:meso-butanediol dehydrogenase/(S,S)-butanediol dehydrogenase/diacetyl reductase